ncbi:3-oxoadipate enol-lactonase [Celeribacter marinus]|uniref:Beta-ketoadipate enol-lactone hydrolase n=1 Tax=Celeribacter marinus TaxID=1397108 RepID=A0A0N7HIJ3_9RHOB|nr:3-oxoadipate enol-lactonase [Celeribacter marinus]ALI55381.1 beta-ketoadipate enol-lactone hydrolase [Celeribacter marinus]SFL06507.1 3-oxoadipate enol-lactonase [Celeribacter marinus]
MRVEVNGTQLNVRDTGPRDAPVVVFSHALGVNLSVWDAVLAHLPTDTLRIIRYDMRGHGDSDVPRGPYSMGSLISDAEQLLDALDVRDCVFVGSSIGGMIAQGLAIKRLDQIRALVLSNTAAKIGLPSVWDARIAQIRARGLESIVVPTLERWFAPDFRTTDEATHWGNTVLDTDQAGYLGCCAAISGTDFYTPTSGLRLACLGIAGGHDGSTPPDLVRETINLIPGSRFELMRKSGHLPCVDAPKDFAALLSAFLTNIGHTVYHDTN